MQTSICCMLWILKVLSFWFVRYICSVYFLIEWSVYFHYFIRDYFQVFLYTNTYIEVFLPDVINICIGICIGIQKSAKIIVVFYHYLSFGYFLVTVYFVYDMGLIESFVTYPCGYLENLLYLILCMHSVY